MNVDAQADAFELVADCANIVGREVDCVELIRFAYYYALKRRDREEEAQNWLERNRPDVAANLAASGDDVWEVPGEGTLDVRVASRRFALTASYALDLATPVGLLCYLCLAPGKTQRNVPRAASRDSLLM